MTSFTLVTPPSVEPVTLADAKAQARIDTDADDALVTGLITAARQWAERYTARAFITQTWNLFLDAKPISCGEWWDGVRDGAIIGRGNVEAIILPRPPLISVVSVQTYDNTDTATVWPSTNYFVDTAREPGRVALRMGVTWPVATRLSNGIQVQYTAGYGADGSTVPEPIKLAIKQLASHWYENRGEAVVSSGLHRGASMVPLVVTSLLDPYRVQRLGGL